MKVGLDVSPLLQTRAGTARYLDNIVGLSDVRFAFGGRGRGWAVARDA